jgi:curved DNA-binding protein CbpA
MELSPYDILGIEENTSFSIIKSAYYDLSKIYHPDSNFNKKLSKKEKEIAFNKIQNAYSILKKKFNVMECDLPQDEIPYETFNIAKNENIHNLTSFNNEFEKQIKIQEIDNPYSVHYNKSSQDNSIISKVDYKDTIYEFGINYVDNFSDNNSLDIRYLENNKILPLNKVLKSNKLTEEECNIKLNQILLDREKEIVLTDQELKKINKEKQDLIKINNIKKIIEKNRNLTLSII